MPANNKAHLIFKNKKGVQLFSMHAFCSPILVGYGVMVFTVHLTRSVPEGSRL